MIVAAEAYKFVNRVTLRSAKHRSYLTHYISNSLGFPWMCLPFINTSHTNMFTTNHVTVSLI